MHRSAFNRSVGPAIGTAVLLVFTSAAWAFDASDYFPLKMGVSWTYDVERRLMMSSGLERFERYMTGWRKDEVIGLSPLSTARTPVYKVLRQMALGDVGSSPMTKWDFVLHVSSAKSSVLVHGFDSQVLKKPMVILGGEPSPAMVWLALDDQLPADELVAIEQLGPLHLRMDLKSQTTETVKVPADRFRRTVKTVMEGSVYGELGGAPVRVGSTSETNWFAKGVGPVRMHLSYYIKVRTPEDQSITITQTETYRLTSYKLPPRGMRD